MLNVLDGFDLAGMSDTQRLHVLAETMRRSFRDRAAYLGDSDFVQVPIERLLSTEHARQLRAGIDMSRATDSRDIAGEIVVREPEPEEEKAAAGDRGPLQTTHFSIMDSEGNVISNTYTLEETFGCKAVAGATGVLMNNEMGDFNTRPGWTDTTGVIGTPANRIAPGKRMLSSMCPLIVLRDGEPYAVLGSPGGRTIINTVMQVFLNLAVLGLDPEEAVAAPRIHHQWFPDRIRVEAALDGAIRSELERMGHTIEERDVQGDCHIIVVDPETGEMTGVADSRIDGCAAGLD
jgi:gamma-glutamyltranspeptidase/glutathione hydrolase